MYFKKLVFLSACVLVASFFLPWMEIPFRGEQSPYSLYRFLGSETAEVFNQVRIMTGTRDTEVLTQLNLAWNMFLLSFASAGALGLVSALGWSPRLVALPVGLMPFCTMALVLLIIHKNDPRAFDQLASQAFSEGGLSKLTEGMLIGIYAYFGSALCLLILACADPGMSAYRQMSKETGNPPRR